MSIDIVNAFNSIPWDRIRRALIKHRVHTYLRNIIGSYLSDRAITYKIEGEIILKKPVNRGVPQGSVLGPLRNLGFNSVLETAVPTGLQIICYADDTIIIAEGRTWTRTLRLVEVGVAAVIAEIEELVWRWWRRKQKRCGYTTCPDRGVCHRLG